MLLAIAVFENTTLKRLAYAQKNKELFAPSGLAEMEKFPQELQGVDAVYRKVEDDFIYYVKKSHVNRLVVISSKKTLEATELGNLSDHIININLDPQTKFTLIDILMNPFGFTGNSVLNSKVVAEVKIDMQQKIGNILDQIASGEFEENSATLEYQSNASRRNQGCCR